MISMVTRSSAIEEGLYDALVSTILQLLNIPFEHYIAIDK